MSSRLGPPPPLTKIPGSVHVLFLMCEMLNIVGNMADTKKQC